MFRANILPGQNFILFKVARNTGGISDTGRAIEQNWEESDRQFYGVLLGASSKEIEQAKQRGHPVTHKIISYGNMEKVKVTEYLIGDNRNFYINGIKKMANLNLSQVYYVKERVDLSD